MVIGTARIKNKLRNNPIFRDQLDYITEELAETLDGDNDWCPDDPNPNLPEDYDLDRVLEGLVNTVDVIDKQGMKIHSRYDDGDDARQDAIDTASLDQEAEDLFLHGPGGKSQDN